MLELLLLPTTAADDSRLIGELTTLVNRAYLEAEAGLWVDEYLRTTPKETAEAVNAGDVAIARSQGRLLGAVRTHPLDTGTAWFGCLAVDPAHGRQGIGRALVTFVEQRAADSGQLTVQLELLEPQGEPHTHLAMLADWYGRLGYVPINRCNLADVEPAAVPFLAMPVNIVVCHKQLDATQD